MDYILKIILVQLDSHTPLPAPAELLSDLTFDDLLCVSGEFHDRINVAKGLF